MAQRFQLAGAVALITGAASGIGAALTTGLAARGCSLLLVDRDSIGLEAVASQARSRGIAIETRVIDLVDADAIRALPEWAQDRFGRLDILINNAGVALGGRFDETHLEDFEWLMDINLRAVVRMCHAFLPMLRARPAAQIVNLSSLFGLIAPPGQVAYCTSKFGVRGFSEALRHEYAGTGLGVTVVHPGGVATAISRNARGRRPPSDPEAAKRAAVEDEKAREAFGKLLTLAPADAAAAIIRGIETRAPRVVIGKDARNAALIQRLMPAGYWNMIVRLSGGTL
ncbi:SDR family NAD(P)-dependent oxidoreductase [Methylobacterium mesophilicum SR1.6/6]|uniref:SDR family NAD(P)-dependent oxidoreductase n=1 Tax=Methylobacterium mesophilicum SR1.6/6 TaxID=908290 RepID=A0A6B9FNH2_9HYPH|nr:SDR family NAD(P)-dependent oxidoreductase [Methylobacterium mesophilicum]QGY02734.1 SDR family NAD(P)-dependent oxidoreductase [Methylobacterium mesophilicum SR1.6/6]